MSSSVAFVVLAHNDPPKVRRLLGTLDGADVYLHCDRRTAPGPLADMVPPSQPGITLIDRLALKLCSWSLVHAELLGIRAALARSVAEHIVVMSGSCYPLVSLDGLAGELSEHRGRSFLELNPIPYSGWSTRRHRDGGRWRFTHRILTVRDNVVTFRGMPLALGRHAIPAGLKLYGSSHWKIYSRRHAQAIMRLFDERPEQIRYWRHTYLPEETCVASLLKSPAYVGDLSDSVHDRPLWFMKWKAPTHHPRFLTSDDFDAIAEARAGAGADPKRRESDTDDSTFPRRKLFARKISSEAADLLDTIDRELRGIAPTGDRADLEAR